MTNVAQQANNFTVTAQWLKSCRTAAGVLNQHQTEALGLPWPPSSSDLRDLYDSQINDEVRVEVERWAKTSSKLKGRNRPLSLNACVNQISNFPHLLTPQMREKLQKALNVSS